MRSAAKDTSATLVRHNLRIVKQLYPRLRQQDLTALRSLTQSLHLSISKGELLCIEGNWYVTNAGLLHIASKRRCLGISTILQKQFCDH